MAIKTKSTGAPKASTVGGGGSVSWEDAPTSLTRRTAFVEVYGDTGTGRTTFALTAPGPIAFLHAGEKIEGVIQPFARDKQIRVLDFGGVFSGSPEAIAKQADAKMREVKAALDDAYSWARTIVIDTHSEMWELLRLARFGKLTQVKPHHYGPVNAEWRSLFKKFRQQDKVNLVCIGQIREKYVNDKGTGRMEQAGQKEMPYYSDIIIRTERTKKGEFTGRIEKGWYDATTEGIQLEGDLLSFPTVLSVVTGLDPEEWS